MTTEDLEIYNLFFSDHEHWERMKTLDMEHIQLRRKTAKDTTNRLFSMDPAEFKSKKRLYKVELLRNFYQALCFFPSEEVKRNLQS